MKRQRVLILSAIAVVALASTGIGVTFAAYIASQETLNFNNTSSENYIDIPSLAHSFGDGSGDGSTAAEAFLIENPIHLRNMAKLQNAGYFMNHNFFFKLSSSFIWDGIENLSPIGTTSNPFTGTFDGNGLTISRLNVTGTVQYAGLFGHINGGTVKNVILGGPTITITQANSTSNYIGFFAGYLQSGTIQDCYVYGGNESFQYNATLAGTGTYSTSCADYFVGRTGGTETHLSFLARADETAYTGVPASWGSFTQCPSSAPESDVISAATEAFSYSYYKESPSATTVSTR